MSSILTSHTLSYCTTLALGLKRLLSKRGYITLSWFNPSQQLSTTQPLPLPPPSGVGRRKGKKKVKLMG